MRTFLSYFTWLGPRGRRVLAVLIILLLVGGVLGLVFQRTIRTKFREKRAAGLLKDAREHVENENWLEARDAALASNKAMRSVEASRLALEAAQKSGEALDLAIGLDLFRHRDATAADRASVIKVFIDVGDIQSAVTLEQGLIDEQRTDRNVRLQRIRLQVGSGKFSDAAALALVTAGGKQDLEVDLLLAREFVLAGEKALMEDALGRIEQVLDSESSDLALQAFRLLGSVPHDWELKRVLVVKAVDRFGVSPDLTVSERLLLARFQIGLEHANRSGLVESAILAYQGTHLPVLVPWLLRLGEFEHVIELTDSTNHPRQLPEGLFLQRIAALQEVGRFEKMSEELEAVSAPLPPPILWAYRGVATARLGNSARAVHQWNGAFDRADIELRRNYYLQLAEIAKMAGPEFEERRFEALARGIEHPFGSPPPVRSLDGLFGWLYQNGKTARLLSISYRLLRREPKNRLLINNYHFLRALHEEPAPEAVEVLEEMIEEQPDKFAFRHSLAFVHLRAGRPAEALAVFDASGVAQKDLPNEAKAVLSAALRALDREEEAAVVADLVDWSQLAMTEVRVLRKREELTVEPAPGPVPGAPGQ